MRILAIRRALSAACLFVVAASIGCKSATEQRVDADRAVYEILEKRRAELHFPERAFTIEPDPTSLRQRILKGDLAHVGPLSIVQCLEIAAENSRDYQSARETLYLSALDLTLERWNFDAQFSNTMLGVLSGDSGAADNASVGATSTISKLLGTGAKIVGNMGVTLARDLSKADAWNLTSDLGLTITQPLLRGAGESVVKEPLTQAERDVLYAVRDFERFRRSFAVDVVSRVYRILQQKDSVANQEDNYKNLQILRERNEALQHAGRLSAIQVDQASQDELTSKNRLIDEQARLEQLLDQFKFFLGLPITVQIEIDPSVLTKLETEEFADVPWQESAVLDYALGHRLDYISALDKREDSSRKVAVAADALRAGLGLTVDGNETSDVNRPLNYDLGRLQWDVKLDVDLPTNRLPERNLYRSALISEQKQVREVEQLGDQIRSDLRDSLRQTIATLEGYRIQKNAVKLAERRIESTRLNLDAGRAATRDLLDAQSALLQAQNSATQALIDYQLAELALYRDLEVLRVENEGIQVDQEAVQPLIGSKP